ncbi:MAG: dienelactone hydrolase family protein [Acidimicrobiia bacterium]|nr:dienelactone hydrolase family protein [Acidimicrobiia bacterium]
MCFEPDSDPPIEPNGKPIETRRINLVASDGAEFAVHEATPAEPSSTTVLVLPDVRGLFRFYAELADRFAEHGYRSLAIDYFGRTAGTDPRPDDFEFMPHIEAMTYDSFVLDVRAALDHLAADRVFVVGFCFGGSNAWHLAAEGLGLAGVIGFYGHPDRDRPAGSGSVIGKVDRMTCPVLALMAGDDHMITPDLVDRFEQALADAGVRHEVVTYPGAPHSFFDRKQEEYRAESEDAWNRIVSFLG